MDPVATVDDDDDDLTLHNNNNNNNNNSHPHHQNNTPQHDDITATSIGRQAGRPYPAAARPASIIGSACQALITTVQKISTDVTNFVRLCRSSRVDLAPVTRELSELLMVLQLLDDYDMQTDRGRPAIPEELQTHLRPILTNCITVVLRIDALLRRHAEAHGQPRWTAEGRDEVSELHKSLSVHRSLMGHVADLIATLVARHSSPGSGAQEGEQLQISEVLEELRQLGSSIIISYSNATLAREHFALQVHLGQIIAYTEALAQTESWEDAVKTLDRAQEFDVPELRDVRSSIPVPEPLRRNLSSSSSSSAAAGGLDVVGPSVPQRGLEKLLPIGVSDAIDYASPSKTPEPDASLDGRAPTTGFFVMDGFLNSDHGNNATVSPTLFAGPGSLGCGSQSTHSMRRTLSIRSREGEGGGAGSSRGLGLGLGGVTREGRSLPEPAGIRPGHPSVSGIEVAIHHEKEVKMDEEEEGGISEEALAFAQVPVHVLGRLSVNLVGHVYPHGSSRPEGSSSDQASYNHSLSTVKTTEGEEDGYYDDLASKETNETGSLRNGGGQHLPFSQLDTTHHPNHNHHHHHHHNRALLGSVSQPSSASYIPSPPFSDLHPLSKSSSFPASQQTVESALTTSSQASPSSRSNPQFASGNNLAGGSQRQLLTPPPPIGGVPHSLREMHSQSTLNSQTQCSRGKPLPKTPIVYIPRFPGPFIKKKVVVVGNFSCGKTCLIARMAKGHYVKTNVDKCPIMETVRIAVDEEPMELSLWDIRGIDYDPTWLNDAHVALVCFSVNIGSTDSKGKHLGRWVAEVNRNCPGAAILLVGLKADIRFHARSVEKLRRSGKSLVTPEQGEQFRENIGASRYLECSARTGDGVLEVLGETARVAMHISNGKDLAKRGPRPLSRIGKFFGLGGGGGAEKEVRGGKVPGMER